MPRYIISLSRIMATVQSQAAYRPKVAVAGLSGSIGSGIIDALIVNSDKYTLPIHAFGRDTSAKDSTETIQYFSTGQLTDPESIRAALKGVDVLIDALGFVPRHILAQVAAQEGVKVVFQGHPGVALELTEFKNATANVEETELWKEVGIKSVQQHAGYFARWFLTNPDLVKLMGFDLENHRAHIFGTGDEKVTFSLEEDIGRAFAELATWNPQDIPSRVYYGGDVKSFNEVISLLEAKSGKKFDVTYTPSGEALEIANQRIVAKSSDQLSVEDLFLALRVAHLKDNVTYFGDNYANELVNPGESKWKWTKMDQVIQKYYEQ